MTTEEQLRDAGRPRAAMAYGGPHGFTRAQLERHTGNPSICPRGDTLYPFHDWQERQGAADGAEWQCAACGLRALDMDEGGVKLVRCEHGEEPGYCDCGFTGGQ